MIKVIVNNFRRRPVLSGVLTVTRSMKPRFLDAQMNRSRAGCNLSETNTLIIENYFFRMWGEDRENACFVEKK